MQEAKSELLELTKPFIKRPDLIQGPGGNTSFKNSSGEMFIKASGFRFEEMNFEKGISAVNYLNIRNYFYLVNPVDKVIEEKNMLEIIQENILSDAFQNKFPKPSMETGFHAVLDRYVVHTHSVWTNLINCNKNRTQFITLLKEILKVEMAEIPFVSPGFGLSYLVTSALKNAESEGRQKPQLFFLANHGIIAHADDAITCSNLLFDLDSAIQDLLNIESEYPNTDITNIGDNLWKPQNEFVNALLLKYKSKANFFEQVLFPDQTVFFNDQIDDLDGSSDKKIAISQAFSINYKGTYREAISIHETMTAYLFLYDYLIQNASTIDFIGGSEIDYINNMEMEKHRKNIH